MTPTATTIQPRSMSRPSRRLYALAALGCLPLAACSTGFGAPTRHATANLQATSTDLGANLEIRGAIVALPNDDVATKGGVAYLQLNAINLGAQADQLVSVTVDPSVAASAIPVGSEQVPALTATGPGAARLSYALEPLAEQLRAGDELAVTLQFTYGGTANLTLPILSQSAVGSFLPSSPPQIPVSSPPVGSVSASVAASPASS